MSYRIPYVGRVPNSDSSIMTKVNVDDRYGELAVSDDFLGDQLAAETPALVTQTYVDTQDALRATKVAVDALDAQYLPDTARDAANGVAPLNSSGYVPATNLPFVYTSRWPTFHNVDNTYMTSQHTCTTTNVKEYEAARLTIPDPGFPYIPIPFALVLGGALAGTAASESVGTSIYGQITILDASNTKWGWCITSGQKQLVYHSCLPFADSTVNPTSRPPVTGSTTLSLYLSVWGGASYTFDPLGLQFYAIAMPGV